MAMDVTMDLVEVKPILESILRQKTEKIIAQLNELIRVGEIVLVESKPILVRKLDSDGPDLVELRQTVELRLSQGDVIAKLQEENKKLRERLGQVEQAMFPKEER